MNDKSKRNGIGVGLGKDKIGARLNDIRAGAAKGKLSRKDANFYYNNSKDSLDFDASVLTITDNRITGKFVVQGEHWSVHGNVWVVDGKIQSEQYDFAYDGSVFRNSSTLLGRISAGVTVFGSEDPRGGGFTINYVNEPKVEVMDWPWK